MKQTNKINRDLRIDFKIEICSGDQVITTIEGNPEIPGFVAPDACADSMGVFESVFAAFIHRPCSIGICRFIEAILKENHQKPTQHKIEEFPPIQRGEPLPPVAETMAGTWPIKKAA